ncbi:ABC transporter substrate-binding protein [Nakamurella multipartita]|uniref:Aliphatic sulfonates family ABC transporter, periplasmic ligand-binding protein n=1 Tax=Nakamurella multipartita (strain ATCC 700099 / DSM 44233 / CIP 104796 / JCM 9543 / NBRC 105858 / Y-104) TaxID=479431 RepID=C8XKK4_NAKMY|nr:ABC transporter substrate-binding protein [Nakamurella multipartita]ACV80661.1 aliphatic sulfonates family ABC transporter, periplasmic ligand-binding protein [Nakamurella multipartita DSM 44233]
MSASRLRFARVKPVALLGGAVAALLLVTACGSSSTASETTAQAAASGSAAGSAAPAGTAADTLRLGYFPNVTHAAAVLGVANGTFQSALGDTKLETSTFNAGPAAIEALLSGAIDATFIGPNPAINSFVKSNGDSIRIVAGATDNGAALVVSPDINSAADLKGKTVATPQLGGTQDVALRKWLLDNGLKVQTTGGDDVDIVNQENSQTLDLFKSGEIAGAWLPEPWASRLALEANGKVLVDEKTLWPDEKFQTTILISSRQFLEDHPDTIKALIGGEITEIKAIEADPAGSQTALNKALGELTGKPLQDATITAAFANIEPTWDPLAGTLNTIAENGVAAGTLSEVPDLKGIYDLRQLNAVLAEQGEKPVSAAGLGQE